jgi:hypothetical protein
MERTVRDWLAHSAHVNPHWWPVHPVMFFLDLPAVGLIGLAIHFTWWASRHSLKLFLLSIQVLVSVCFLTSISLLFDCLGRQGAALLLIKLLGLYGLRTLVGIGVVFLGVSAWNLKKTDLFVYGLAEVLFGICSAVYVASGLKPDEILVSHWAALIGSAYVVARGLGNTSDGWQQIKEGKAGPIAQRVVAKFKDTGSKESAVLMFREYGAYVRKALRTVVSPNKKDSLSQK